MTRRRIVRASDVVVPASRRVLRSFCWELRCAGEVGVGEEAEAGEVAGEVVVVVVLMPVVASVEGVGDGRWRVWKRGVTRPMEERTT
jgi:hypothetical protein